MRIQPDLHFRYASALTLVLLSFLLAAPTSLAGKNNNGKGGKGGDSGPAVQYVVSLFSPPPSAHSFSRYPLINNQMQVAGGFTYGWDEELDRWVDSGYFYDPEIHNGQAVDLNTVTQGLPDGQMITRVWGLNDQGLIAVTIGRSDAPDLNAPDYIHRAGLVDTADGYQFHALPSSGARREIPVGLNNSDDVALIHWSDDSLVTRLASYDSDIETWSLWTETFDLSGAGISDRLPIDDSSYDLYLIGGTTNAEGKSTTVRINVTNPGVGEVVLSPVQVNRDLTYIFFSPSSGSGTVNELGDFVGPLRNYTERTRGGKTTTSTVTTAYLMSDDWVDYGEITHPRGLNNQLDFIAPTFAYEEVLVRQDLKEPLDIRSLVDASTAPEFDWEHPDFTLECSDLTDRGVADDGDSETDFPVIVGYESYSPRKYVADFRHGFLLIPVLQSR